MKEAQEMGFIDMFVIVTCNIVLIGVGLLVYSGKLDSFLTGQGNKKTRRRGFLDMEQYHKWALLVCVVVAALIDIFVVITML